MRSSSLRAARSQWPSDSERVREQETRFGVVGVVGQDLLQELDRAAAVVVVARQHRGLERLAAALEHADHALGLARLAVAGQGALVVGRRFVGLARAHRVARAAEHIGGLHGLARLLVEPCGARPLRELLAQARRICEVLGVLEVLGGARLVALHRVHPREQVVRELVLALARERARGRLHVPLQVRRDGRRAALEEHALGAAQVHFDDERRVAVDHDLALGDAIARAQRDHVAAERQADARRLAAQVPERVGSARDGDGALRDRLAVPGHADLDRAVARLQVELEAAGVAAADVHRLALVGLLERAVAARSVQLAVHGDPVAARHHSAELRLARHQVVFGARRDLVLRRLALGGAESLAPRLAARQRHREAAAQVVGVGDADHQVAVTARGPRAHQRERGQEQAGEQPAPARRIPREVAQAQQPRLPTGREAVVAPRERRLQARRPALPALPQLEPDVGGDHPVEVAERRRLGRGGRDRDRSSRGLLLLREPLADQLLDARRVRVRRASERDSSSGPSWFQLRAWPPSSVGERGSLSKLQVESRLESELAARAGGTARSSAAARAQAPALAGVMTRIESGKLFGVAGLSIEPADGRSATRSPRCGAAR